jgi:hypothetical protein
MSKSRGPRTSDKDVEMIFLICLGELAIHGGTLIK